MKNHFGNKVYISWKSFLLKQAGDTPDRAKFVRYSQGWESIHNQEKRTEFRPWEGDNDPPSGSLPAQIAHKLVSELWPEKAMLMHYRLLEAYFSEHRTISDWGVLTELVSEIDADSSEFLVMLNERKNDLTNLVIKEHNEAVNQGVTAVPTVLINHVLPVPGAQESETYINWIERIIERERSS